MTPTPIAQQWEHCGKTITVRSTDGHFECRLEPDVTASASTLREIKEQIEAHSKQNRASISLPVVCITRKRGSEKGSVGKVVHCQIVGVNRTTRDIIYTADKDVQVYDAMPDTADNEAILQELMETRDRLDRVLGRYQPRSLDAGARRSLGYGRVGIQEYPDLLKRLEKLYKEAKSCG